MDPKDLKNSEELNVNLPQAPDQQNSVDPSSDESILSEENVQAEITQPEVKNEENSDANVPEPIVIKGSETNDEPQPKEEIIDSADSESEKPVEAEVKVDEKPEVAEVEEEPAVAEKKAEPVAIEEEPADVVKEPVSVEEKVEPVAIEEAPDEVIAESDVVEAKEETVPLEAEVEPTKDQKTEEEVLKEVKAEEVVEVPAKKEIINYSELSQVELVNALRDLIEENSGKEDIKSEVETIKAQFYKLLNQNIDKIKKDFIDGGGLEEEFKAPQDPYEQDIKDLLKKFRQIRIDKGKRLESVKDDNLREKFKVIEAIKGLINNEESINKTFHEFRELQNKWREIGLVPQSKMKDLWETYHFHVENFYDYIKINKELRDLDLRKNLELKIVLCERAEELLAESSIIKAFNNLQKYHEQWREIGPVPREKKDEIWERFKAATAKINKKHQEFFENRKSEQKKNLDAKAVLCEQAEEILNVELITHKDWDERSKKLIELQKVWRTIGFAPKRDNNKIYERFRTACDKFFDAKRDFYAKNKELQQNNLQEKIDLCVQAEALKESTDWKKTTQDFVNIQRKWKEVGPVPRKHSDAAWKRFRAACDYFFERKSEHFSSIDGEQVDNLKLKQELISEVAAYTVTSDIETDLKKLKEFQRRWTEIGHVPIKQKDEIQNIFRETINKHFDDLNLDDSKRNMLKFRNKMTNFSETSRGLNKMRIEREKYTGKLKQLESDLVLLDNNIGFFAQSKNAESMIADVNAKIEQTKEKIKFLKNKIKVIDDLDDE